MKTILVHPTPLGFMTLVEDNAALVEAHFGTPALNDAESRCTPLLSEAAQQLDEYFAGKRRSFTLPLRPSGTQFQQACWQVLLEIPYGETLSYGQQAALAGNPKACRAAGMANHRNPLPIFIPCHRVIGKNGQLTGYGSGLEIKEFLLKLKADKK